ncbi:MAG: Gfo/Idh/MocA family oxidoreductase [Propionibacteriales bacterium]|nr:Gfo/Idh/MocA family oxidoreductase [Propionibacteriales bacterium]
MKTIRWGILATGKIARSFAADLLLVDTAELVAIGSRTRATAQAFAAEFGARRAYDSYAGLADDPDVDVVYVATPHALHRADVTVCLEAGKAVLCEKALALNARDAQAMVDDARSRGLFFMEAMWMRCNPTILATLEMVRSGAIGDVTAVGADFGFRADGPPTSRLFDPALGASAVLDIGIYPLTFAWLFLGEPVAITSAGTLSDRGIDLACSSVLSYADQSTATLSCTTLAATPGRAYVAGTRGRLELGPSFQTSRSFTVVSDAAEQSYSFEVRGLGYVHEIEEVHRCLREGRTESSLVPLDDTVAVMHQMDLIRHQVGSSLPGDDLDRS